MPTDPVAPTMAILRPCLVGDMMLDDEGLSDEILRVVSVAPVQGILVLVVELVSVSWECDVSLSWQLESEYLESFASCL